MFLWPLLIVPPEGAAPGLGAPVVFLLVMPAILAIVMSEVGSGELDTKAIAMLGVLTAIGAALRPLGARRRRHRDRLLRAGAGRRVYGPGFGFVLGTTTMFASAVLTGGLGPWLPFQMLASGLGGPGRRPAPPPCARTGRAGDARRVRSTRARSRFGFVLNMWFWPYTIGADTQLSYVAGGPVVENLHRFFLYTVATSTLGLGHWAGRSPTWWRSWCWARRSWRCCTGRPVVPAFDAIGGVRPVAGRRRRRRPIRADDAYDQRP